ncbi:predicted protein [Histoplasma capsulatum var. duboisii H88]|uniref:Predicted protein n=2 Tax=Ajellomyces capsulatus TaxID=5037 RepID=F0UWC2_AJEC8|nr:predicted protein [Histoplasma capsulatum H143]EGC42632.1 predicted protein [Histoplasma capsulatum var. duboisii H88]
MWGILRKSCIFDASQLPDRCMDTLPPESKSNNACEVPLAEAKKAASLAECFTDDLVARYK